MPYSTDKPVHIHNKVLENRLRLCVLDDYHQNGSTSKTCLSISLNKGHFSARDFPEGLAHLFEHMLFSSSKRFPDPKKLDEHLFEHHGQFNAWTQDDSMNIQMSCEPNGFLTALDILIDRLCHPLFNIRDIEHETSVLDAEFNSKKNDPLRKLLSVQKATCNQQHPFSRFSSGNAQTLSHTGTEKIQSDLINFHRISIQGPNISVCVGTNQTENTKQFRKIIIEKLNQIPSNKNVTSNDESELPLIYNREHLKKLILVEQSNMTPQLVISYIVKHRFDDSKNARSSAYLMLSHMLESKHKNGLFYQLKKHNLIEDISCDFKHLDINNDEFFVNLKLTKYNLVRLEKTLELVQRYIGFISQKGIENWRYREKSEQYKLATKLERPPGMLEQCINISQLLLENASTIELEHYVHSCSKLVFEKPVINTVLSQLQPTKKRVYVISDDALTNTKLVKVTPHFGVRYATSPLPDVPNRLKDIVFEKPRQNPYMPKEVYSYAQVLKQNEPLVKKSNWSTFKFYQQCEHSSPIGECYLSISDPKMGSTAQQIRIKRIWVGCLQKACETAFFDAHLASLHHRIYAHKTGVTIHIQGVSEKQILYSIELLNLVLNFKANSDDIKKAITRTREQSSRSQNVRPLNQMFNKLIEVYQPSSQIIKETPFELTEQDVLKQQEEYFNTCFVECLMIGNWQVEQALKFEGLIQKRLKDRQPFERTIIHPKPFIDGIHVHTRLNSSSTVVVWHYTPAYEEELQQQTRSSKKSFYNDIGARAIILERILSFTVFNVLRQKYNMGYSLGVGYKPIGKLPGIAIYVDSPSHCEQDIFTGLREVLDESAKVLHEKEFDFNKLKREIVRQVTPEDKSLRQTANRAWLHFDDDNPLLGYKALVTAIKDTHLDDIERSLEILRYSNKYQVISTLSANDKSNIETLNKPTENTLDKR